MTKDNKGFTSHTTDTVHYVPMAWLHESTQSWVADKARCGYSGGEAHWYPSPRPIDCKACLRLAGKATDETL